MSSFKELFEKYILGKTEGIDEALKSFDERQGKTQTQTPQTQTQPQEKTVDQEIEDLQNRQNALRKKTSSFR